MDALSEVCREEIAMMRADSARDDEEKWRKLHEKIYHCLAARDLKKRYEGHYGTLRLGGPGPQGNRGERPERLKTGENMVG